MRQPFLPCLRFGMTLIALFRQPLVQCLHSNIGIYPSQSLCPIFNLAVILSQNCNDTITQKLKSDVSLLKKGFSFLTPPEQASLNAAGRWQSIARSNPIAMASLYSQPQKRMRKLLRLPDTSSKYSGCVLAPQLSSPPTPICSAKTRTAVWYGRGNSNACRAFSTSCGV